MYFQPGGSDLTLDWMDFTQFLLILMVLHAPLLCGTNLFIFVALYQFIIIVVPWVLLPFVMLDTPTLPYIN